MLGSNNKTSSQNKIKNTKAISPSDTVEQVSWVQRRKHNTLKGLCSYLLITIKLSKLFAPSHFNLLKDLKVTQKV